MYVPHLHDLSSAAERRSPAAAASGAVSDRGDAVDQRRPRTPALWMPRPPAGSTHFARPHQLDRQQHRTARTQARRRRPETDDDDLLLARGMRQSAATCSAAIFVSEYATPVGRTVTSCPHVSGKSSPKADDRRRREIDARNARDRAQPRSPAACRGRSTAQNADDVAWQYRRVAAVVDERVAPFRRPLPRSRCGTMSPRHDPRARDPRTRSTADHAPRRLARNAIGKRAAR